MWRAGLSYCLLAESLCRVRESDSVLLLQAEFWRPVWSELGSVPNLSHQGALCSSVPCIYILLGSLLSQEEECRKSERVEESLEFLQWRASEECIQSKI